MNRTSQICDRCAGVLFTYCTYLTNTYLLMLITMLSVKRPFAQRNTPDRFFLLNTLYQGGQMDADCGRDH